MDAFRINRRRFLGAGAVGLSAVALPGCDAFDFLGARDGRARRLMERANDLTYRAQRLVIGANGMAREFTEADIRQPMRPNGVTKPDDPIYSALAAGNFADYRLEVSGLVERPLSLSLDQAGVRPEARYVMFHCLDTIERSLSGEIKYYGSIDLVDARHPQTILAYGMNGDRLPIENGAPLRVRVERQLGYKMPKYLRAIHLVDKLTGVGFGRGGYWEDRGYDWYAGI